MTARFYVGTDPVKAMVDLNTKLMSALDLAPPGVTLPPLIKPKCTDDVPILTLTLWSKSRDWHVLRRIASTLETEIKRVSEVADVFIVGGRPREIRIILDPLQMEAYRISPLQVAQIIKTANVQEVSGNVVQANQVYHLRIGEFLRSKEEVENILVGLMNGKTGLLKGTNAVTVAEEVLNLVKLAGEVNSPGCSSGNPTIFQIYVGTNSPFSFNGLARRYYLRQAPNLADIQINLINKHKRLEQSHDFAKRIRPEIHKIAQRYGSKYVAVVEVPPGPPVLSPIVAEVYGPDLKEQERIAREILRIFKEEPSITDEGIYLENQTPLLRLIAKEDKLKLAGLTKEELVATLRALIDGYQVGLLQSTDTEHVPIVLKLEEKFRKLDLLKNLKIPTKDGKTVTLVELVEMKSDTKPETIYHKNLRRVVYVIGDGTGREDAPFYGIMRVRDKILNLPNLYGTIKELWMSLPLLEDSLFVKWDGEMQITIEVFRDLGLAFVGAIFVMYVLILGWFKNFRIPGIIMAPIPLTLIGIIPGHLLLGSYFTATSMIGFIALAGIIVRNSILLVDFAEERQNQGVPLPLAVIEAGVTRSRPILLTAIAIIVGAFVILFDPIFNGLAISLSPLCIMPQRRRVWA